MIETHRINEKALFAELDKYTLEEREQVLKVVERLEGLPPVLVSLYVLEDGAITQLVAGSTGWTAGFDSKVKVRRGDIIELRVRRHK